MSFAMVVMRRVVRRLLLIQFFITLIVAITFLAWQSLYSFYAALYGGSITLSATLLMAWRLGRATEIAASDKQQGKFEIYTGAIQKFFLTLLMMAVGMGLLKLDPVAIIVSFALTQLSFAANKVDTSF